ncbi:pleckstrin homology domain-containing family M member 2-like [Sinocyclocheilus grahami]|uniref:pleckstrin homology domain-containing family M member 2-like n=1 Tax=Sinocyclocheilus grahami TaxID=75366 RepID=UPI0007AD1CDE|nr:PREDICTED: pleckstrin homology domain-containing family M member 2-like [Sinocyclocheilus grahami]
MDQLKVKDRILENISLSVKKLQSYFAACEDETPAIRNHDRVLQRLCEHLDHALLYGLQDISSGYWVLVLHFTRREAVQQIDELQHIATNLGRIQNHSKDVPYLDVAPYMPEYYKPHNLLDFEERLPSSDSLSLHSFTSLTSTNLEWDDSAIAPSSEDYDFGDIFPVLQSLPSADWEEGDLTDPVSGPRSSLGSDPQTVVSDCVVLRPAAGTIRTTSLSQSPTFRHNPFIEDSDTNTSADVTPVHMPSRHASKTGEDAEITNTELEVIRMARRRRPGKKRRGRGLTDSVSSEQNVTSPDTVDTEECLQIVVERDIVVDHINMDCRGPMEGPIGPGSESVRNGRQKGEDEDPEAGLRLPEMTDTSMDSVGEPLRDIMDRLNGSLDGESWQRSEGEEEEDGTRASHDGLPHQRPFREDSGGKPPDPSRSFLQAPLSPANFYCFTSQSPDLAASCGGHNDSAGNGESQDVPVSDEDEGKAETPAAGQDPSIPIETSAEEERSKEEEKQEEDKDHTIQSSHAAEFKVDNNHLLLLMIHVFRENEEQLFKMVRMSTGHMEGDLQPLYLLLTDCYIYLLRKGAAEKPYKVEEAVSYNELDYISVRQDPSIPIETSAEEERSKEEEKQEEDKDHTIQSSHAAEFKVDNNHLLLLMIHVFRENEEQLFKMVRMSTGHMEGDLQPLYLLLTDCYIYLLRKGAAEKPYKVEEAVSYNELDYISVGLHQQTITLVCTNRRRQFLLDTADSSLTVWFLTVLKAALEKGCREPLYPSVLTDATMEKLALSKFVCQETHCELPEMSICLYSLVHWEDPMDAAVASSTSPFGSRESSSTKEGALLYRAGSTYLGKEVWKSCYLVLSNGILYQYAERTDITPLMSVTMGGGHCGGCRRSNSLEKPHAFQVILTEHPPLVLSAENELEMADWMQLLCQSVSKGIIPQGVAPAPCIPCCLVLTDRKLLTCHQDCQTSFFRSLGGADLNDVTAVCLEEDKEYCVIEFAEDRAQFLPPWVLYFSGCEERDRLLGELSKAWAAVYQVSLPRKPVSDLSVQKRCREALELMKSAWQRSDSLHRGRSEREPWC